jgi:signal transduction histidine kinase
MPRRCGHDDPGHRHRWQRWQQRWGVRRISWFVRARLRRRIFWSFALGILVTGAVAFGISTLVSPGGSSFRRELERGRTLLGHLFEPVWDDAAARERLARTIAEDAAVDVILRDPSGDVLLATGAVCARPLVTSTIARGRVDLCAGEARSKGGPLRAIVPFLGAIVVLWAISGRIARRLARPYDQLAKLARDLGEGRLDSRLALPRHSHDEAAILGRVLNDMAARIERQLDDQRELLATVSHEIRTPLARIRLLTEIARDQAPSAQLDEIDREVVEIDELVGALLANARVDFTALRPTSLDPADVALRALERAGLPHEILAVESTREISADPTLLARALANLLDNGKKHGRGVVALRIVEAEGEIRFEVEDRGAGIPDDHAEKIFDRFYSRAKDRSGLGLGLALVRRIAEAHRGRAWARNGPEGGAIVGLSIPIG